MSAATLTGIYRLVRGLAGAPAAIATTILTAIYPIWFAQSTLAHADIFAAAFTLWALSFYFLRCQHPETGEPRHDALRDRIAAAVLFSLAALAKETAIITPIALALLEIVFAARNRNRSDGEAPRFLRLHLDWTAALLIPILPLIAWYAYHRARTGFTFGNPEFLRYNATANLGPYRIVLSLWHRVLHLTTHMNLFVATGCTLAALLMPSIPGRGRLSRAVMTALAVILAANLLEYSILGGALLTRYLLPIYPLVLLLCVIEWRIHLRHWPGLAALTAAAFLAGIWINPPYAFAPEDNLTYRDMIVLHQKAVAIIAARFPAATVLTAWPGTQELGRPELGYTTHLIPTIPIKNFSLEEMQLAAADPGAYDVAFLFSTKWEPRAGAANLGRASESTDQKYFDFHHDLRPAEAARLLHGDIVWQQFHNGEWAAVLHFPRSVNASLSPR